MRFLLLIIVVLLLVYAWWPERQPPPLEETFMGDQVVPLRKTERFEQKDYLEELDRHRANMDTQEDARNP